MLSTTEIVEAAVRRVRRALRRLSRRCRSQRRCMARADGRSRVRRRGRCAMRTLPPFATLLQQGADVNGAQGDGMTALHWAAEHGDHELTRAAPRAPAPIPAPGRASDAHAAPRRRQGRPRVVVRLLVDAKADVARVDHHRRGAAALCRRVGQHATPSTLLLDAGADVNVARAAVGTDAADVRGRPRAAPRPSRRCWRAAPTCARPRRSSTSARAIARTAPRAARGTRASPRSRSELRPPRRGRRPRRPSAPAARARAPRRRRDAGNEPEPLGYADLVGAQGGLTALLLASRDGLEDTVVRAARRRRRHQPGERVRSHQPAADGDDQRPFRSRRCGCSRAAPT